MWASAEYLLWWIRDMNVPPLVTTGPATVNGLPGGAILGAPGTVVLFGGHLDNESFNGGRFTVGTWFDCCNTCGLEASYLFLGERSNNFIASCQASNTTAVLGRPFFDLINNVEGTEQPCIPGFANGRITIVTENALQGAELNGIYNLCCGCAGRLDLLGGFRWLELREGLGIDEQTNFVANLGPFRAGDSIDVGDIWNTHNDFYGGQIGARAEVRRGRLFADLVGKVALGDVHEEVQVSGATTLTSGGVSRTLPGGLLTASGPGGTIGSFEHNTFAVVPELGINVGFQVTDHVRAFVGYTFLYWSDVVRPGDQINTNVNIQRLPVAGGAFNPAANPAPGFTLRETDFWAQGVSFGVEVRY
jgi:hypothetical protein